MEFQFFKPPGEWKSVWKNQEVSIIEGKFVLPFFCWGSQEGKKNLNHTVKFLTNLHLSISKQLKTLDISDILHKEIYRDYVISHAFDQHAFGNINPVHLWILSFIETRLNLVSCNIISWRVEHIHTDNCYCETSVSCRPQNWKRFKWSNWIIHYWQMYEYGSPTRPLH